jgi:hypothetical protein
MIDQISLNTYTEYDTTQAGRINPDRPILFPFVFTLVYGAVQYGHPAALSWPSVAI